VIGKNSFEFPFFFGNFFLLHFIISVYVDSLFVFSHYSKSITKSYFAFGQGIKVLNPIRFRLGINGGLLLW